MLTDQLSTEARGVLSQAAGAAADDHARRPWRLEVGKQLIDVRLDCVSARRASVARAQRIATGAAVLNLRCAAASLGYDTWPASYPDPQDRGLAVRIVVQPTALPDQELRDLYAAILTRRRPLNLPDPATRFALERAAELEHAHLRWFPRSDRPLAVLSTDRNDVADQIRTGMALQRVLLTALAHDVRTTCLNPTLIRFGGPAAETDTPMTTPAPRTTPTRTMDTP